MDRQVDGYFVLHPLEGEVVQVTKKDPDSGAVDMETVAIITVLSKHKHYNGKAATFVKRLETDRWVVRLDNHKEVRVKEENLASRRQGGKFHGQMALITPVNGIAKNGQ